MENIKSLLTNNMNPQARLMEETRGLQGKWAKTGLLEGLSGIEKANMSILLENQAKQLIDESTSTGSFGVSPFPKISPSDFRFSYNQAASPSGVTINST